MVRDASLAEESSLPFGKLRVGISPAGSYARRTAQLRLALIRKADSRGAQDDSIENSSANYATTYSYVETHTLQEPPAGLSISSFAIWNAVLAAGTPA